MNSSGPAGRHRRERVPPVTVQGDVTNREEAIGRIRAVADRVVQAHGLELFDLQLRKEPIGLVVRVFIDRPGPAATPEDSVSIEDCARVSREMSAILDVEDPIAQAYTLEVSSPGLDRPLRDERDFLRFTGRYAKIVVSQPIDRQTAFAGRIRGVENGEVLFEADGGRPHRIPLALVRRAHLDVEF